MCASHRPWISPRSRRQHCTRGVWMKVWLATEYWKRTLVSCSVDCYHWPRTHRDSVCLCIVWEAVERSVVGGQAEMYFAAMSEVLASGGLP